MIPWSPERTRTDYWFLRLVRQLVMEMMVPMCVAIFYGMLKWPHIATSLPWTGMIVRVIVIGIIAWARHDASKLSLLYYHSFIHSLLISSGDDNDRSIYHHIFRWHDHNNDMVNVN
jgi:hypothetical protein